jgi:hypothetical protein
MAETGIGTEIDTTKLVEPQKDTPRDFNNPELFKVVTRPSVDTTPAQIPKVVETQPSKAQPGHNPTNVEFEGQDDTSMKLAKQELDDFQKRLESYKTLQEKEAESDKAVAEQLKLDTTMDELKAATNATELFLQAKVKEGQAQIKREGILSRIKSLLEKESVTWSDRVDGIISKNTVKYEEKDGAVVLKEFNSIFEDGRPPEDQPAMFRMIMSFKAGTLDAISFTTPDDPGSSSNSTGIEREMQFLDRLGLSKFTSSIYHEDKIPKIDQDGNATWSDIVLRNSLKAGFGVVNLSATPNTEVYHASETKKFKEPLEDTLGTTRDLLKLIPGNLK